MGPTSASEEVTGRMATSATPGAAPHRERLHRSPLGTQRRPFWSEVHRDPGPQPAATFPSRRALESRANALTDSHWFFCFMGFWLYLFIYFLLWEIF